jgi:hypothetical protein
MNRIVRVSYIIGKRTVRLRTNKFRTASTRFIPYVVDIVNSNDYTINNFEFFVDTIAKAELITLAVQVATVIYNLKK